MHCCARASSNTNCARIVAECANLSDSDLEKVYLALSSLPPITTTILRKTKVHLARVIDEEGGLLSDNGLLRHTPRRSQRLLAHSASTSTLRFGKEALEEVSETTSRSTDSGKKKDLDYGPEAPPPSTSESEGLPTGQKSRHRKVKS